MDTKRYIDTRKIYPPFPPGVRQCRFCRGPLPPRKRAWCSKEHMLEAHVVCGHSWAIYTVLRKRDNGICADCGMDCYNPPDDLKERGFNTWNSIWEAHHVVPVISGGARLGSANLITLCQQCHKTRHRRRPAPEGQTEFPEIKSL